MRTGNSRPKRKKRCWRRRRRPKRQNRRNIARALPKGDFAGLISMLFTQTLFSLGFIQVKDEEKREPDLALAKYNIDMLEMLEEKTKGNLSDDEQKALTHTLNELRMAYVKVAEAVQNQNNKTKTADTNDHIRPDYRR